jgi:hypothetical protein
MFAQRSLSGVSRLLATALLVPCAVPALVTAQGPAVAHATKQKKCPNPKPKPATEKPPVYVRVVGVTCDTGYALARKVKVKAPQGCLKYTDTRHIRLTNPCRVEGYRCTSRELIDGMALEATCKRGAKLVRFQTFY